MKSSSFSPTRTTRLSAFSSMNSATLNISKQLMSCLRDSLTFDVSLISLPSLTSTSWWTSSKNWANAETILFTRNMYLGLTSMEPQVSFARTPSCALAKAVVKKMKKSLYLKVLTQISSVFSLPSGRLNHFASR